MKQFDFHAPLNVEDSEKQTFGCRHSSPDICGKNSLSGICAFVRDDEICQIPPRSWSKQYRKLLLQQGKNK